MRLLLAVLLVLASFCAAASEDDCPVVYFPSHNMKFYREDRKHHELPVYRYNVSGANYLHSYLFYNSVISVWAMNHEVEDSSAVTFQSESTQENRPWLAKGWKTGSQIQPGYGIATPICYDCPVVSFPTLNWKFSRQPNMTHHKRPVYIGGNYITLYLFYNAPTSGWALDPKLNDSSVVFCQSETTQAGRPWLATSWKTGSEIQPVSNIAAPTCSEAQAAAGRSPAVPVPVPVRVPVL
eukprot:RCo053477